MPWLAELTVRVVVPEPLIVSVLKVAESPEGAVAISVTLPMNPFNGVIVTVEFSEMPLFSVKVLGLAEIPKSTNAKVVVVL